MIHMLLTNYYITHLIFLNKILLPLSISVNNSTIIELQVLFKHILTDFSQRSLIDFFEIKFC